MTVIITFVMLLIFLLAFFILWREGLLKSTAEYIICIGLLAAAFIIRSCLLDYESDDYLMFLKPWTQFFRDNGGFAALGNYRGNYNPPYMYCLALFSYIDINELYLIKLLSVLFDVLLAWACMKLTSLCTDSHSKRIGCFFAVLLFPTVILNGAYWGQCDSIYSFFGIYALYLGLSSRPAGSMITLAASLAFKLQAVFIMPVFFILLIAKKISLKQLLIFPAAYIVFMLPTVIAGMPFMEVMTLYVSQAGTVGDAINYNAPSLTSMIYNSADPAGLSKLLIIAAFAFMLLVFIWAIVMRGKLNTAVVIGFAALLAVGIPYLLPHMHDRYFFLSGMLLIVIGCIAPYYALVPLLAELASLHCYCAYFARHYLFHPRIGGEIMALVLVLTAIFVAFSFKNKKDEFFEISS